ncbi:MAG: TRP-like protein [Polyangiaceae bacterium]
MSTRPEEEVPQKTGALRADILALLRDKRYEEALAALYRARSESPSDPHVQKSIEQVKEFLIGAYAKRLGGLDRVAALLPRSALRSPDSVLLARYVDGASTFDDLTQVCPLGKLRTLQVLLGLYAGKEPPRIEAEAPTSGVRLPEEPLSATSARVEDETPAPDTARSASVAAVVRNLESEESRRYKESFAAGTAAFVQHRYQEAVDAFEACLRLRPTDQAADVMLRRALRDLGSR